MWIRPKIKICGVTRQRDARRAVELGADFIGLNFYPKSPRCLDVDRARAISEVVADRAATVGVVVNAGAEVVRRLLEELELDFVQFHGDETPEEIAEHGRRAWKAFRAGGEVDDSAIEAFPTVGGFLFDAAHSTLYGGTGHAWSYTVPPVSGGREALIAGGINAENCRQAFADSGATGLDVCSGVEGEPGVKDWDLMERLFAEVNSG